MVEVERKEIWKEEWYKNLRYKLSQFKTIEARIEALNALLTRRCGPATKLISSYGIAIKETGDMIPQELELEELKIEYDLVNASLKSLDKREREIVTMRFIDHNSVSDIAYETKLAHSTIYNLLNGAMAKMGRIILKDKYPEIA